MSNLNNTVKKDDLDELTAMLQLLDEPEKLASEAVVGDEIDDLLADLNDETIVPVPAVAETVMEAKDGGDLTGVFEELENEYESLKVVDVEIPQVESISTLPEIDSTQGDKPQTDEKKEKHAKESSVAAQPKESKAAKKERAAPKPRFNLNDKGDDFYAAAGLKREVFIEALNSAPVKAKDKISNLLNWFNGGPDISIYTVIALRHLIDTKEASSNSIKLALMSYPEKPYPLSTASTQAGQMMAVFPVTGIATRDGGRLLLNEESPIVRKFIAEYSIG